MTILEDLMAGNETYQSTYTKFSEKLAPLTQPRKKLAVLTCIDAQINPIRIFHLNIGDIVILRNAGNKVTEDVLRSLLVALAHGVSEIVILGHSACGMAKITREKLMDALQKLGGSLDPIHILLFNDWIGKISNEELNVSEQVNNLRAYSLVPPSVPIHGLLYDVVKGSLKIIVNGYEPSSLAKTELKTLGLHLNMPMLNMPSISFGKLLSSLQETKPPPKK